mmetsp:Transcript_1668/g.2178  ORF Transcript_1668/g.2178 Transcript_1668/m.2178 type:complete len:328 (-) Transcript_1668:31-1014(-)
MAEDVSEEISKSLNTASSSDMDGSVQNISNALNDHTGHGHSRAGGLNAHSNHEGYHSFLFLVLIAFVMLSQFGLFYWKQKHYRSFQNITLLGLWLVPFGISLLAGFWRMLLVWTVFSGTTLYLIWKASQSPIHQDTPKQVYAWFYWMYRLCYACAVFGYFLLMADIFGIPSAYPFNLLDLGVSVGYAGMLFIFYGLYYGVLGRDCAEMCTDRVASKIGFTGKGIPAKQLPPRTCGICGEEYDLQTAIRLNCHHQFHEWCIRGWTIVGKKDTCPFCSEKVELKKLFSNPWEKQGIMWANLMDALRYLIVWNPIILTAIQLILYVMDPY